MATCPDAKPRAGRRLLAAAFSAAALVVAVFPYAWLGQQYRPLGHWMDAHFWRESRHHIAHSIDFAAVSLLLLTLYPVFRRHYALFATAIFSIACIQESLQLLYKNRLVAWNDGKDVVVDLTAATLTYLVYQIAARLRRPRSHT